MCVCVSVTYRVCVSLCILGRQRFNLDYPGPLINISIVTVGLSLVPGGFWRSLEINYILDLDVGNEHTDGEGVRRPLGEGEALDERPYFLFRFYAARLHFL